METIYQKLNKSIEIFLIVIFTLLVIDVVWQVFSRYVIGQSNSFTEEFARFALIWLSVLGAAYLHGKREHLSMDYLVNKLDEGQKAQRLNRIDIIVMIFAIIVMVIGGANLVYTTLYLGQVSPAMHVPLGYIYSIVPFSGLLIVFYSFYNISHSKTKV
ncbi:MAG: TRAP transporter small permease [Saprospiraceae bacterium]